MSVDCLSFHLNPSKPKFIVPNGSVDAHCHVFGPNNQFPYHSMRKYTPCDAPKKKLFKLRNFLGFKKNVIVQASCHGTDNSALLDALKYSKNNARGVAVINNDISDKKLKIMDKLGVRGIRFNFLKRLANNIPHNILLNIAAKIKKFDWHIVVYFELSELINLISFLKKLDCIVVVDHMGRPDILKGIKHKDFQRFIQFMIENKNIWTKVSCPERLINNCTEYSDVEPFSRLLVNKFSDRVLWGTDWPHPNMTSHIPDDGYLVDIIPKIALSSVLQKKLLIDNPMKLYWKK